MYTHIITSSSNLYVKLNRFVLFFSLIFQFDSIWLEQLFYCCCCWLLLLIYSWFVLWAYAKSAWSFWSITDFFIRCVQKAPKMKRAPTIPEGRCYSFAIFIYGVYSIFMCTLCTLCTSLFIQYGLYKFVHPESMRIQAKWWKWNENQY